MRNSSAGFCISPFQQVLYFQRDRKLPITNIYVNTVMISFISVGGPVKSQTLDRKTSVYQESA